MDSIQGEFQRSAGSSTASATSNSLERQIIRNLLIFGTLQSITRNPAEPPQPQPVGHRPENNSFVVPDGLENDIIFKDQWVRERID